MPLSVSWANKAGTVYVRRYVKRIDTFVSAVIGTNSNCVAKAICKHVNACTTSFSIVTDLACFGRIESNRRRKIP
jgi:hypothetical protein